jgi:hypothetical protein
VDHVVSAAGPEPDDTTAGPTSPGPTGPGPTGSGPTGSGPIPTRAGAAAADRDPVLVRRDQYERLANLGQRIGYLLLGLSVVAFMAGVVTGFPPVTVTGTIVGLVGSCIFLPPAIVAGFAVKAAEREDRQAGQHPGGSGHGGSIR